MKKKQEKKNQMRFKALGILFVALSGLAVASLILYWQMAYVSIPEPMIHKNFGTNGKKYTDTGFGFQFDYDKKYELDTSGNQANFFKFEAKSLVSASVPQSFYPKTNFGSANLTVAVQTPGQELSCQAAPGTEEINGIIFHESELDGAAAGTHYQTKIYRVFHNQACFEVSLTMGIANIGNFEPGAVAEIDQDDVWKRLDEMLDTFKFTDSISSTSPTTAFPATGQTSDSSSPTGILSGPVIIGPNCPVERAGSPCPPALEAFAGIQIFVYKPDGTTVVASMNPKAEMVTGSTLLASYSFKLQPGKYLLDYKSNLGINKNSIKRSVTITAGKNTNLDINIDTGIR